MARAKRHHQVPQFYLRSFADPKDRVVVLDRRTGRSFSQNVQDVSAESNLYTIRDENGTPTDKFERSLGRIETEVAPSIKKLLGPTVPLGTQDFAKIAGFAALQFVRTSSMRDQFENLLDLNVRMSVEANVFGEPPEAVERFIDSRYADKSDELKDQIRLVAANPGLSITLSNEAWTALFIPLVLDLTRQLVQREWWVASSEHRAFATCDDPVVLIARTEDLALGVGMTNAAQVLIPLSPYRVLIMDEYGPSDLRFVSVDRDWIRWVNSTIASRAHRQIIWHPRSDPLKGISVSPMPRPSMVNGIQVNRGERSWDKLRPHKLPHLLRLREEIRAKHEASESQTTADEEA